LRDASEPGRAAASWDAEYAAGRYAGEAPVAFTRDILAAARRATVSSGLYTGCGNGRNYLPLVAGGLDLTGLDISPAAITQLAARAPGRRACGRPAARHRSPASGPSGKRSGARIPEFASRLALSHAAQVAPSFHDIKVPVPGNDMSQSFHDAGASPINLEF
jgi:hypothetical protein